MTTEGAMNMLDQVQIGKMLQGDKFTVLESLSDCAFKGYGERVESAIMEDILPEDDMRTLVIQYVEGYPREVILHNGSLNKQTLLGDMMAHLGAAVQLMDVVMGAKHSERIMGAILDLLIRTALMEYMAKGAARDGFGEV